MIDWDEMGLNWLPAFLTAVSVLAYLEQHPVDILITDIQMRLYRRPGADIAG